MSEAGRNEFLCSVLVVM